MFASAWLKNIMGVVLTPEETELLAQNERYSIRNLINPLHKYFELGGRNLFEAVPYDMLHTLNKGLLQNVFMWTLSVIYLVSQKRNTVRYRHNLNVIDKRMRRFPIRQSILPCEAVNFPGVSCFIPESKSTKAYLTKQYMNPTKLEAQKYLSLLFQLVICIGCSLNAL